MIDFLVVLKMKLINKKDIEYSSVLLDILISTNKSDKKHNEYFA